MSSRRQLLESLLLSRLPSAFQEVEYIESSGTQYIDSGVLVSSLELEARAKINCSSMQLTDYPRVFGARQSGPDRAFMLGQTRAWYGVIGTNQTDSINLKDDTIHEVVLNKNELFIDNISYPMQNIATTLTSIQHNICLFAENERGSVVNKSTLKLYYFKLYDNNVLVRNFVPCYRKSDNEIGLYDLVNGVFYTNAGTGTFTKGANV